MASSRMLLGMVSLTVITLLWPPSSPAQKPLSAHEKMCQDEVAKLYKRVEALEALDALTNDPMKASVKGRAQDAINLYLPKLKDNCPTAANSLKDLENGNYLRKLAAAREKRRKAIRHVTSSDPDISDADLDDLLEFQR